MAIGFVLCFFVGAIFAASSSLGLYSVVYIYLFIFNLVFLYIYIYIYIYILVIGNIMNKSLFIQVEIAKNLLFIYINTRLKINK